MDATEKLAQQLREVGIDVKVLRPRPIGTDPTEERGIDVDSLVLNVRGILALRDQAKPLLDGIMVNLNSERDLHFALDAVHAIAGAFDNPGDLLAFQWLTCMDMLNTLCEELEASVGRFLPEAEACSRARRRLDNGEDPKRVAADAAAELGCQNLGQMTSRLRHVAAQAREEGAYRG